MIRYIDLNNQITCDDETFEFAWYDTVRDQFIEFNSSQIWQTWEDFENDFYYDNEKYNESMRSKGYIIGRFKKLFPKEQR